MANPALAVLGITIPTSALTAWLVTWLVAAHDTPPPPPSAAPSTGEPAAAPTDAGTTAYELERLRSALQSFAERLRELELRRPEPSLREPVLDAVSAADFVALQQEVRALLHPERAATSPAPELKTQVAAALKDVQKEQAVARVRTATEQRSAKLEERLATWTESLQLDPGQAANLRTVLATKDARDRELITLWQNGADDRVLGETKQAYGQEFETAVASILTPTQRETLRAQSASGGTQGTGSGK
jgi:hypothetical protein